MGVVPGGAKGRSVNPFSTKGNRLCPPKNTGTPGFSDLPTALYLIVRIGSQDQQCASLD